MRIHTCSCDAVVDVRGASLTALGRRVLITTFALSSHVASAPVRSVAVLTTYTTDTQTHTHHLHRAPAEMTPTFKST